MSAALLHDTAEQEEKQLVPYLSKACATSRSPQAVVLFLSQTTVLQGEGHGEPCARSHGPEVGAHALGARKREPRTGPRHQNDGMIETGLKDLVFSVSEP